MGISTPKAIWSGACAVVIAVILAGCTAVTPRASVAPSVAPADTFPASSSTPSPSPTPTGPPTIAWTSVVFPGTVRGASFDSGIWLAVGSDADGLAAWTSTDGRTWARHDVPPPPGQFQSITAGPVARLGDAWYIIGIANSGGDAQSPVVWKSSDATIWGYLPTAGAFMDDAYIIWGEVSSPSTLVALATDFAAWTSSTWLTHDGVAWAQTFPPRSGPASYTGVELYDVLFDGAVFLAVGETEKGAAGAWKSVDGQAWTPNSPSDVLGGSTMYGVSAAPSDGYVAVGLANGTAAAWSSRDGIDWAKAEMPSAPNGVRPYSVCLMKTGLVALGRASGKTAVWTSVDGRSWDRQEADLSGQIPEWVGHVGRDLVATDGETILAFFEEGQQTKAWMGVPSS